MAQDLIDKLKITLEEMDKAKDEYLFVFIRKHWPRKVTPNHLTLVRIVIGFLLFVLLFNFKNENGFLILPLFLLGAATDLLDGAVARCLHLETRFGQVVDPIADRILIIPIAVYTIMNYQWLLFSIIFLEIVNAFISFMAHDKKIFFGSNIFGKAKMMLQSIVLIFILLLWPRDPNFLFIALLWLSVGFMIISITSKIVVLQSYYARKNI